MMQPESPEPAAASFEERSPSRILRDRAKSKRTGVRAPKALERCSALALIGVAGFGIALMLAATSPSGGTFALVVMLASTVAILGAMVVATLVSTRNSHPTDGQRISLH